MANDLYIIGTGGLAKETALMARQIDPNGERWRLIHYVTKNPAELNQVRPYGVIDFLDSALATLPYSADVVIGVGHPFHRRRIALSLLSYSHLRFPNLIHPSVVLDLTTVSLGKGNIICQGVVISCDINIGDFNLINFNSTVGHDCRIGSYNVINPCCNISGGVTIKDACLFGVGSCVLENLYVSENVTLGAGAVLTKSIHTPGGKYVGVPARLMSQ